jgi:hypothetical protein
VKAWEWPSEPRLWLLFLPIEILQSIGPDEANLGTLHDPFLAVGIVAGFPDRVVRDNIEHEIF